MGNQNNYDKQVDLHDSEWRKAGKKEPILGAGSFWFFRVTLPVLILGIIMSLGASYIWRAVMGY